MSEFKPILAIVIPCFNEELCVNSTAQKLLEILRILSDKNKISEKSYLYFVDDGSTDKTWQIIEELHNANPLLSSDIYCYCRPPRKIGQAKIDFSKKLLTNPKNLFILRTVFHKEQRR